MALNARETRVLMTLGAILVAGGLVRFVSNRYPQWTPGVVPSSPPDSVESVAADPTSDAVQSDPVAGRQPATGLPAVPARPAAPSVSPPARSTGGRTAQAAAGSLAPQPAGRPPAPPDERRPAPPARSARSAYGTAADLDSLFVDGRLDLNAAGEAHLVLLPGIGPSLAARVVEYRRSHGPFRRVEDLTAVRGIGPKTMETLRAHVCVRP